MRNIYPIISKLENDMDIGQFHPTVKIHEDIPPLIMKTISFDFAIFFNGC